MLERHAIQKLHGDECPPCVFANVMNSADVGVIERGSCFGLALEAFEGLRVTLHAGGEKFERDEAAQLGDDQYDHAPEPS